ncbi:NAD(P)H-dependent oxidoreductase [Stackebrandtia albiflava]|nr:NAD(P)H-dependent oxidoreductase [Stackebrandtia albiflava]
MRLLWIFAHPEPRSLNGALRDHGTAALRRTGHEVRESDLYAMGWNPVVSPADTGDDPAERFVVGAAQETATCDGRLRDDIRAEQAKVMWADAVVIQFPMWWFGPPAILKGWFDRVFTQGFAFGVRNPRTGRKMRYGENTLWGRRAMVITSYGARDSSMGPRGIHGDVDALLFPVHHGILWYTGIAPVAPFIVDAAERTGPERFARLTTDLEKRLLALPDAPTLGYRHQEGGHYDENLVLRPQYAPGRDDLSVHVDPEAVHLA